MPLYATGKNFIAWFKIDKFSFENGKGSGRQISVFTTEYINAVNSMRKIVEKTWNVGQRYVLLQDNTLARKSHIAMNTIHNLGIQLLPSL